MIELTYTFKYPSSADTVVGGFEHFLNNPTEYYSDSWDDEVKAAYKLVIDNINKIEPTTRRGNNAVFRFERSRGLESALRIILKQLFKNEFSAPGSIKF